MKKLTLATLAGAVAALSLFASQPVAAQSVPALDTYDAIDKYEIDANSSSTGSAHVIVTGLLHGASAASTKQYYLYNGFNVQACDHALALSMARPGRYAVELNHIPLDVNSALSGSHCALVRRTTP